MKNRILLLISGALLTANFSFAQKCGTYEGSLEEDIQKYPDFYQTLESKNAELKLQHEKALSRLTHFKTEDGIKIIPVVVHVIHDMGGENISDASIQGALDVLNANINGQAANFLNKTPQIEQGIFFSKSLYFSVGGMGKININPFSELAKRFYLRLDPQNPLSSLTIRAKSLLN